jgi:hypothetical protein
MKKKQQTGARACIQQKNNNLPFSPLTLDVLIFLASLRRCSVDSTALFIIDKVNGKKIWQSLVRK